MSSLCVDPLTKTSQTTSFVHLVLLHHDNMIKDRGLEKVLCAGHNARGRCVLQINGTCNDMTTSGCRQCYRFDGVVICGVVGTWTGCG